MIPSLLRLNTRRADGWTPEALWSSAIPGKRTEHLWSPAGATGGNRRRMGRAQKPLKQAGSAPSTRRTLPSPSTLLRRISSARQPSRATRVLSREVGDCYASERERLLVRLRSAATSPRVSSASARRTRPRTSCSPSSDAFTTLRRGVVVSRARANTRSFLLLRQLPLVVAGKGLTIPGNAPWEAPQRSRGSKWSSSARGRTRTRP